MLEQQPEKHDTTVAILFRNKFQSDEDVEEFVSDESQFDLGAYRRADDNPRSRRYYSRQADDTI